MHEREWGAEKQRKIEMLQLQKHLERMCWIWQLWKKPLYRWTLNLWAGEGDAGHLSVLPVGKQSSSGQEFTTECWLINDPCTDQELCPASLLASSHCLSHRALCLVQAWWEMVCAAFSLLWMHFRILFCTGFILDINLFFPVDDFICMSSDCYLPSNSPESDLWGGGVGGGVSDEWWVMKDSLHNLHWNLFSVTIF